MKFYRLDLNVKKAMQMPRRDMAVAGSNDQRNDKIAGKKNGKDATKVNEQKQQEDTQLQQRKEQLRKNEINV